MKTRTNKRSASATRHNKRKSRANHSGGGGKTTFESHVVLTFLEFLNTVKLFHWKTHSYATHKATDDLQSKLSDNVDKFVETMIGKTGDRIELANVKSIRLNDYSNDIDFKNNMLSFKTFLINLSKSNLDAMNDSDLLNIRDEMLGNVNQFLYLLTFK